MNIKFNYIKKYDYLADFYALDGAKKLFRELKTARKLCSSKSNLSSSVLNIIGILHLFIILPKRFHFGQKFDDAEDELNNHPRQKEKNNHTNCEGKVDQIRKVA